MADNSLLNVTLNETFPDATEWPSENLTAIATSWASDNTTWTSDNATISSSDNSTNDWASDNFTNTTAPAWPPDILILNTSEPETSPVPFYLNFRSDVWTIPLVTLSFANITAILIFEIYVLYKCYGGKRHLLMGQVLLFGLFLCSVVGLSYVPEPHFLFCGIRRAGLGVAYAIVFAGLFVKCVFLLKLHNGIYINAPSQSLLLFFAVAVQVTIAVQWLVYEPPGVRVSLHLSELVEVCYDSPLERVQYLSYVMFLLFLLIIASIRVRSLVENNKEAFYIGISTAISLVIWVAWVSVSIVFDRRYDAPAEAFGIVCTATVVFLLIFIPKAMQMAAPSGEFNNGSTVGGSRSVINTPSFLHLQPHAVLPCGAQDTFVKPSSLNADYCRVYPSRMWRYDYPSFHQMEPSVADSHSLKKSNFSSSTSRIC